MDDSRSSTKGKGQAVTNAEVGGDFVRSVARRSAPLWERTCPADRSAGAYDPKTARDRRQRWRQILGSAELLRRRLRFDQWEPRQIDRLLGGAQADAGLPSWTSLLEQWLSENRSVEPTADRALSADRPLPFDELLIDLVRIARRHVSDRGGVDRAVLGVSAAVALERQLLAHLSFVSSLTLGQDFFEFRFSRAPAAAVESVWSRQPVTTGIYRAYLQHMDAGGLADLLHRYPVLARLLCQSVEQWIQATIDLCRRFSADYADLVSSFGWEAGPIEGALENIRTDLSDRHRGGQSVHECRLRNGERVIYKPRTVEPEAAFYGFIARLNRLGLPLELKVVLSLDRGTHGWVEYVPVEPCRSEAEIERYHARAGMLLAALHVLAITDVHCENLIASGEYPVVVDLETLLSERPRARRRGSAASDDGDSIFRTGFLPQRETAPDGRRFDMSALGADDTQDPGLRHVTWRSVNTDQMTVIEDAGVAISKSHRVRLGDRFPTVAEHLPQFLTGFEAAYDALMASRPALLSDSQLLEAFEDLELRVLVRSTETYTRLHLHLLHPEYLQDGIDRSLELEWLARPVCATASPRTGRAQVYESERRAMEMLDIPHFGTGAWQKMKHADDDRDFRLLCGDRNSQVLCRRLAKLSVADRLRQVAVIEQAILSRFAAH
ncbi:MAG TPA: type 2 lanthipeptide synthetase LanM [Reyranella sp.]|jgi:type 2 lantibiotic biosynthesis protein LanM